MHDVVCTMYDVQSEINFVTQLVIRQISIVRMAHAERNPRLFCRVLDRCDRSNFLFLIVLMVRFMRDYAKIFELCSIMRFWVYYVGSHDRIISEGLINTVFTHV